MTYRVLIVDDEPKIRKLISDFLKKDGYLTEEAINGEDALDKWKHQTYDGDSFGCYDAKDEWVGSL